MKLQYAITTAALALAGSILTQPAAHAATGAAGDLILSFRFSDNSNTNDLEIDLGQQTNFTATTPLTILTYGANYYAGANTGGLASSDLDAVFGTTGGQWNTLSNLVWDVSGHTGSTQTNTHLWATQTIGLSQGASAGSTLTSPGGRIGNLTNGFDTANTAVSLTSPEAVALAISPASQSEYTGALRNAAPTVTTDFGFFSHSTEMGVSSSSNEVLELFTYGPNTVADLGTFTLTPSGGLTFQGAQAAPEPTTFGLLGMAAVGLVTLRRRRATA